MKSSETPGAVGIIAEYNPFHLGHQYHIRQARAVSGARWCIVVMSGDFVQRGGPAIFSKYDRTRMALMCGADLVLELPSLFASSSAPDFALSGAALLDALGVVDSLCFGSECGDISLLNRTADLLLREPDGFGDRLRSSLRLGHSYPAARSQALDSETETYGTAAVLQEPNNILGVEYCLALKKLGSSVRPLTIARKGSGYHDPSLEGAMASATALRRAVLARFDSPRRTVPDAESLQAQLPSCLHSYYNSCLPLETDDFSEIMNYALLTAFRRGEDLSSYADWSPDLAARMKEHLLFPGSVTDRIGQLKTRNMTYTRASRALFHLLLGHRKEQAARFRENAPAPYARILGFRREAEPLLSKIKKQSRIPLISKTTAAGRILDQNAMELFSMDLYASHLYQSVLSRRFGIPAQNEFSRPVLVLQDSAGAAGPEEDRREETP